MSSKSVGSRPVRVALITLALIGALVAGGAAYLMRWHPEPKAHLPDGKRMGEAVFAFFENDLADERLIRRLEKDPRRAPTGDRM